MNKKIILIVSVIIVLLSLIRVVVADAPWASSQYGGRINITLTEPNKLTRDREIVDVWVPVYNVKNCTKEFNLTDERGVNITRQVWNETYNSGYCTGANVVFYANVTLNTAKNYTLYYNNSALTNDGNAIGPTNANVTLSGTQAIVRIWNSTDMTNFITVQNISQSCVSPSYYIPTILNNKSTNIAGVNVDGYAMNEPYFFITVNDSKNKDYNTGDYYSATCGEMPKYNNSLLQIISSGGPIFAAFNITLSVYNNTHLYYNVSYITHCFYTNLQDWYRCRVIIIGKNGTGGRGLIGLNPNWVNTGFQAYFNPKETQFDFGVRCKDPKCDWGSTGMGGIIGTRFAIWYDNSSDTPTNERWYTDRGAIATDRMWEKIGGFREKLVYWQNSSLAPNQTIDDTAMEFRFPLIATMEVDSTPPTYSLNSTNSTTVGTPVLHSLKWLDNVGMSGYIFGFYNGSNTIVTYNWTSPDQESNTQQWIGSVSSASSNTTIFYDSFNGWDVGTTNCNQGASDWNSCAVVGTIANWGANNTLVPSMTNSSDPKVLEGNDVDSGDIGTVTKCLDTSAYSLLYVDYALGHSALDANEYINVTINKTGDKTTNLRGVGNGVASTLTYYSDNITNNISSWTCLNITMVGIGTGLTSDRGFADDFKIKGVLITYNSESNETWQEYSGIDGVDYLGADKIKIIINVSSYDPRASNNTNTFREPDLEVGIFNGTHYINNSYCNINNTMGNNALNTTAWNCTITKTDSQFLNSWNSSSNRKVISRGIFMDSNATYKDEINVTSVFGYVDGWNSVSLLNDTWVTFNSNTWSNVTKGVNGTSGSSIKWQIYAKDTSNNWNASSVFTYDTTGGETTTTSTTSTTTTTTIPANCWTYDNVNHVLIIPSGCVYHNDTVGII
jgi:hypothetical protein